MSIPYTYRIYHIPTKKYYYGCKYSKTADPKKFWIDYFTSSKLVDELIQKYGPESFETKITKIFKNSYQALKWETKFLKRINAASRPDWLNQHNGGLTFYNNSIGPFKGKKHKESSKKLMSNLHKGKPKSEESKRKNSESHKGTKRPKSEKWCKNQSKLMTGINNPNYGKINTKLSERNKNNLHKIIYNDKTYLGYKELFNETGITFYHYKKYILPLQSSGSIIE